MNDIMQELAEGPKAKVVRRKLRKIVPRQMRQAPAPKPTPLLDRGIASYLGAMARISAVENSRPNRAYSLIGPDPAATVGAGAPLTASFTLPTDAFLVYWVVT